MSLACVASGGVGGGSLDGTGADTGSGPDQGIVSCCTVGGGTDGYVRFNFKPHEFLQDNKRFVLLPGSNQTEVM